MICHEIYIRRHEFRLKNLRLSIQMNDKHNIDSPPSPACPGAPKAPRSAFRAQPPVIPYWKTLRSSGRVRKKYTHYTPEDVEEIEEKETILFLQKQYCFPSSQPQNWEEENYFLIMAAAIRSKLEEL